MANLKGRRIALTLAVIVLAISVTVACSSPGPTPASPAPTTTLAPSPTNTPSPEQPASTPPTTAPSPEPASAGGDPTATYFDLDRVLDIEIEIAPEDWDTLRHQTRTFEDFMAEIEEFGLSRPFASIYTWFSGTVTVDGETHFNVGVRKKGFLGSQSDTKPALKVRFDKYVDGQSLGGVMARMTLNNSVQDPSMINTCLTYQVFAETGSPSPRCNFATVSVNGQDLGLYVHVEEIKKPFLARHFDSVDGNLYEGTVSDFTPEYRGTIEKKTNEDIADWSDIDAVVAALHDRSEAGLSALGEIVDLDRFLSFWATEVLVGHWDGYAGNHNNFQFYREPDGPFVFIPWGVDDTFHLKPDPNPFDNISNPPPSVLALTAIPNRLYNHPDWRTRYVVRMKALLENAWNEDELLAGVDRMADIVRKHALPDARSAAAKDTDRVRKFILKRRGEILADITPEPPDWPDPDFVPETGESGYLELSFNTTWGSNTSINPFEEGTVTRLLLNGSEESAEAVGVIAGHASPDEQAILPGVGDLASIAILGLEPAGSVSGLTMVLPRSRLTASATLVIGEDPIAGGTWYAPAGASVPTIYTPLTSGVLKLSVAGTGSGSEIVGSFSGVFGGAPGLTDEVSGTLAEEAGLYINEVASKGDPLDWFELYNATDEQIELTGLLLADDLNDVTKLVPFPDNLAVPAGGYLQIELDKDGWPGFALGGDEELGIWTEDGALVDWVDWDEGESGEGQSFARVPDGSGEFRTVDTPTPGGPNGSGN